MAAGELRHEIVSLLVHELRNPLGAVLGSVRSLRGAGVRRSARQRHLDVVETNALRIEELLDSLSLVSSADRAEALSLTAAPTPVDVVLRDAAERARKLMGGLLRVSLEVRCDSATIVNVDLRRMVRALAGLAVASMTFASKGGVVAWTSRDAPGRIELDLPDPGIDLHDDHAPRVHDEGFWASRPRAVGLRLTTRAAVLVVRAHGGAVVRTMDPDPVLRVHLPRVP